MAIYDRQPTDTPRSWEAFEIYRDLGTERSYGRVLQELCRDRVGAVSGRSIERWASKHDWQGRVKAWDMDQAKVRQEESKRMRREQYQQEILRLQKTEQQLGQGLVSMAVDAMKILKSIMEDPEFQARTREAPIGQISSLMGASQRVADSGIALYERALGIDELLSQMED